MKNDAPKILGFHGPMRFMSNFVPVEVILDGIDFPSVEHAYVAAKTLDVECRQSIRLVETAGKVKRIERELVLREDWEQVKFDIMRDLLIQKFSQEPFRTWLLETGNAYLEETNHWGDVFWGVCDGIGENNLGRLLMGIRGWLQNS